MYNGSHQKVCLGGGVAVPVFGGRVRDWCTIAERRERGQQLRLAWPGGAGSAFVFISHSE